jgi:DNA-binding CsgD family transcriptional regulator
MNKERIKLLLNEGYSIKEVANELNVDSKSLYHIAKKYNLPYNAPIKDGGPKEKRIYRLSNSGFSDADIGRIFKISPKIVRKIIEKHSK